MKVRDQGKSGGADGQGEGEGADALLRAFSRDLSPAADEIRRLLADLDAGKDVRAEAGRLLERLPDLIPDDPAMAAVLAEEMAAAFGGEEGKPRSEVEGQRAEVEGREKSKSEVEVEQRNGATPTVHLRPSTSADSTVGRGVPSAPDKALANTEQIPAGHANAGQFTGKTNQPEGQTRKDDTHTPEEKKRIDDYQSSTDQKLVDFYEEMKGIDDAETLSQAKCKVGNVSPRYAERVKDLTGLDTEGWTIELRGNRAKHIDIRHGGKGEQDQSLADSKDVGRINYVMQNFDSVDYCRDQNGNKVLSGEYQDKNGPAPVLETRMKIDGTFAIQEAVPDSKWKKIYIVSARIEKAKEP